MRGETWSDERIAELRRLHGQGLKAKVIADRFGISRNAVMGKMDRLGLGLTAKSDVAQGRFKQMVLRIGEHDQPIADAARDAGLRWDLAWEMWCSLCRNMGWGCEPQ